MGDATTPNPQITFANTKPPTPIIWNHQHTTHSSSLRINHREVICLALRNVQGGYQQCVTNRYDEGGRAKFWAILRYVIWGRPP